MENFDIDDLVEEGRTFLESNVTAAAGAEPVLEKTEDTKVSKHEAFLAIPKALVIDILKNYLTEDNKVNAAYLTGNLKSKLSAVLEVSDEVGALDTKWVANKLWGGWNNGLVCKDWLALNGATANAGHMECVPVKYGDTKLAVVTKCRYKSVPFLPSDMPHPICNTMFRMGAAGVEPRPIPANFVNVLTKEKLFWPGSLAPTLIAKAKAVGIRSIPNPQAIGYLMGPVLSGFRDKGSRINPLVGLSITPLISGRSIFSGKVLSQWTAFFDGFAYDDYGVLTAARAVCAFDFDGYYGGIGDVALWSRRSLTLKVRDRLESVVEHRYIDFRSVSKWPKSFAAYNLTPEELNLAQHAGIPAVAALILPLTNVLAAAPQVKNFAKHHDKVKIDVVCCSPPLMVIRPTEGAGLFGATIKKHLELIEKAFVVGYLKVFCSYCKVQGDGRYTTDNGFSIVPGDGYSASVCSVEVKTRYYPVSVASNRFVSMSDKELHKFVPTIRMADVQIDGNKVANDGGILIPEYPRCTSYATTCCIGPIRANDAFGITSGVRDRTFKLDVLPFIMDASDFVEVELDEEEISRSYVNIAKPKPGAEGVGSEFDGDEDDVPESSQDSADAEGMEA